MPNLNPNSTSYQHSFEPNTNDLTTAMDYNAGGQPYVRTQDFNLAVSQGKVPGVTFNHKFGAVPSMSNGTTGTVWDVNDTLYPWTALDTPAVVNIERNSASDNGLIVTVQGLDSEWNYQTEDIVITGGDQTGTKLFRRVNRAFVTSNTASTNVGDIDIEAGSAGGTTVARISAGLGQTLMAVYTIPAGKTGFLYQGTASVQQGADATGFMMVRYNSTGVTFRVGHTFEVEGNGGQYFYKFPFPIPLPEKTDIDVRAAVRTKNCRVTAAFDLLLVDN